MQEKTDLTTNKESLNGEIEKALGFMLRINEESFNQGVRQVAFLHGVPADDSCYNLGKDVINDQLVPLGGEDAEEADRYGRPTSEDPSTG